MSLMEIWFRGRPEIYKNVYIFMNLGILKSLTKNLCGCLQANKPYIYIAPYNL